MFKKILEKFRKTKKKEDDFLPFDGMEDNYIYIGNHKYRKVMKCNSSGYTLRVPENSHLIEEN